MWVHHDVSAPPRAKGGAVQIRPNLTHLTTNVPPAAGLEME